MSEAAPNIYEFSVSELSFALKRAVEDQFGHVRVRGEISGFKRAASGHLYMALKDDKAVLEAVMWKGTAGRLGFRPEDGLEVIATGKLTTYPGRSKYQIVIEQMEPAGVGALMALLEERKKKLAAEGLFASERKRPLPFLPKVIGVVTSPTGSVIRDILHRLAERCPRHVLVWPVLVQGEGAAEQIARAIDGFNRLPRDGRVPRPDLLIVARGGGSLEDLWCFNEEIVVRAAAASDIPLISAVGHETDTTLIDYASDRRAPTPTAAAEIAVPVLADLRYTLSDLSARLDRGVTRYLTYRNERVASLSRAMPSLREIVALPQQRLDELAERLPRALRSSTNEKRNQLDRSAVRLNPQLLKRGLNLNERGLADLARRLDRAVMTATDGHRHKLNLVSRLLASLSYESVLKRGYALVHDASGAPVKSWRDVEVGEALEIEFHDGRVPVVAGQGQGGPRPRGQKPKRRPRPQTQPEAMGKKPVQGSLL